jgi:hypothetical protein
MGDEFSDAQPEAPLDEAAPPRLFGPERLNAEEASRLLSRGPGRLVVWLGEEREGTTSLTAALYESQRRARGETRFAGSWTLLALEALIGHGPAASAERADDDGREVLHLALSVNGEATHLLFAELPGEAFRRLADNEVSADDGPWLRRADRIAVVVDGEHIRDPTTRSNVLTRVRQLVERLRARELPDQACRLALVVVRWDRVQDDIAAAGYWSTREAELLADLRTLDAEAPAMHVANGRNPDDHGIAVLRAWLLGTSPPEREATPAPQVADPLVVATPWNAPEPVQSTNAWQVDEPRAPEEPQAVEEPWHQEPRWEQPVYQEPVYQEPAYTEPVDPEPAHQEPAYTEPVYEEPVYEEPVYKEPVYQEPTYEQPRYEEPQYEEGRYDESRFESPPAGERRSPFEGQRPEPDPSDEEWLYGPPPRRRLPWRRRR